MGEFEYKTALPSFAKYVEWYRTCRKYDILPVDLESATKMLGQNAYDPKSALLLMSMYNEEVSPKIRIDIPEKGDPNISEKHHILDFIRDIIIGFIFGVAITWITFSLAI